MDSRLIADYELLAHRAWNPPTSSSLAEEERLRSLLLSTAARDLPTLAADGGRQDGEDWTENYEELPGSANISIILGSTTKAGVGLVVPADTPHKFSTGPEGYEGVHIESAIGSRASLAGSKRHSSTLRSIVSVGWHCGERG